MLYKKTVLVLLIYYTTTSISINAQFLENWNKEPRGRQIYDTEQIEYRLKNVEAQVAEKVENLRAEMREGSRRLQTLENENTEIRTTLERFRNELVRFVETNQKQYSSSLVGGSKVDKLESRIDNLHKMVQLVVAALRIQNTDITSLQNNISDIMNATNDLVQNYDKLNTKQFLTNPMDNNLEHCQLKRCLTTSSAADVSESLPANCKEVQQGSNAISGIYRIQPDKSQQPFMVYCDMITNGGGWTYIHNRFEGSQDFYLNYHDYKQGFGNLGGEFWLGLEHIHQLTTNEINELLIELVDRNNVKKYARYSAFSIGSEAEGYSLKVLAGYEGDAGNSLIYHAGSRFSTKDLDLDNWPEGSCAQTHTGAWWYKGCDTSNLNGQYLNGELPEIYQYQGMYWSEFKGALYSLAQARMMIRPNTFKSYRNTTL